MSISGQGTWRAWLVCTIAALGIGAGWAAQPARAAGYPNQTIRLVVPLGAGSATDILARQLAAWMAQDWHQSVIVENRPGAGSMIAAEYVAKQPHDGYTLLLTGSSIVIAPLVDKSLGQHLDTELLPVARVAVLRIVLATNAQTPAPDLQAFAALTRAHPGTMYYAGLGDTSVINAGVEALKEGLHMDLTAINYNGATDHITALIRNDVQLVWGGADVMKQQARSGKVRLLAAVADHRFADLPDVPSIVEAGYHGYLPRVWTGILVPAGTPAAITQAIDEEINRILARPAAVALLADKLGNDPAPSKPGQFAADVRSERAFWQAAFKAEGVTRR